MEPISTDVLIVGAGPTGLALACQCLRYAIDFVLIDTKETITPFSKALGVQARTLEIYEQINLADQLVELGLLAHGVRFFEGGQMRGEVNLDDLATGLSAYPFLLIVEQNKHEKLLLDHIASHGKGVEWQHELIDFAQDENGVTAQVKTAGGESKTIQAQYLAGCDGAKSLVRHRLGLEFEGSTFERLFYVADVEIQGQLNHEFVQVCLAQSTITAFFPIKGKDRYRIVGTFPEGHDKNEGEILYEEIERQIVADTQLTLDISHVNWFSVYKVHSRHVQRFSRGRCFLAGDAAHVHTPAGAQGMNTGIQDGYNLAWKLALALRGRGGADLLDTYNNERLENARNLIKTTDRFFDFGASPDPVIAYLRTHIFPHIASFMMSLDTVKHLIFPLVSQIGIHYRHSKLSKSDGLHLSVNAGDRMPYFLWEGDSIYSLLQQPKFHYIIFDNDENRKAAIEHEIAMGDTGLIDFHSLPLTPDVMKIFGTQKPFHLLLRPDNYIAFITDKATPAEVQAYFDGILK